MSVLIEANSVVVKKRAIEERFPGGLSRFAKSAPNSTFCADDSLVRLVFMSPPDVQDFVGQLGPPGHLLEKPREARVIAPVERFEGGYVSGRDLADESCVVGVGRGPPRGGGLDHPPFAQHQRHGVWPPARILSPS